jgi:hypothetical protein
MFVWFVKVKIDRYYHIVNFMQRVVVCRGLYISAAGSASQATNAFFEAGGVILLN